MKRIFAIAAVTSLTACAFSPQHEKTVVYEAGKQPTREQIEEAIRGQLARLLKDPDSMKQFAITRGPDLVRWSPHGFTKEQHQARAARFEYNAKNSYGGHVGLKRDAFAVRESYAGPGRFEVVQFVNWGLSDWSGCF